MSGLLGKIIGIFARRQNHTEVEEYEAAANRVVDASQKVALALNDEPIDNFYDDVRGRKRGDSVRGDDERPRSNRRSTVRGH